MRNCLQCGNEIREDVYICPYCGGQELSAGSGLQVKRLDLGHADLDARSALEKLKDAVLVASSRGDDVIVVIHGYGSSGTGGSIRGAVRSQLSSFEREGTVSAWIAGEDIHNSTGKARDMTRRLPALKSLREWREHNPGVSILICR